MNYFFSESFTFHFLNALTKETEEPDINFAEILMVSCLAVFVGLGITAIDTYKLLHRIARFCRFTKKTGELDTFTFLVNDIVGKNPWVIIRDVESNRAYYRLDLRSLNWQ